MGSTVIDIIKIDTTDEIIENYHYLKDIPWVKTSAREMLSRCLAKETIMQKFVEDKKTVGIVIYLDKFPTMHVCGVHSRKKLKLFRDMFYSRAKADGFNRLTCVSQIPEKKFIKSTGFKKLHTFYGKVL